MKKFINIWLCGQVDIQVCIKLKYSSFLIKQFFLYRDAWAKGEAQCEAINKYLCSNCPVRENN